MYWSYNIKGVLPKYLPPRCKESHIENYLEPYIEGRLGKTHTTNFLVKNIKKNKEVS